MNPTLVLHTALQRAMSPPRVLLALSVALFPAVLLSFAPQLGVNLLQSGGVLAMILGAGLIGQDVSSGVLQLLFARPVTRAEYVLSRWFAVGACAAALLIVEIGLGTIAMTLRGAAPPLDAIAAVAAEQILAAFGLASVLALLSTVLPGIGDVMAWIVLNVAGGVLQMFAGLSRSTALVRAGEEWARFLNPVLPIHQIFGSGTIVWFPLVSYFSTLALCLALAIVILNRRELSYATD